MNLTEFYDAPCSAEGYSTPPNGYKADIISLFSERKSSALGKTDQTFCFGRLVLYEENCEQINILMLTQIGVITPSGDDKVRWFHSFHSGDGFYYTSL